MIKIRHTINTKSYKVILKDRCNIFKFLSYASSVWVTADMFLSFWLLLHVKAKYRKKYFIKNVGNLLSFD